MHTRQFATVRWLFGAALWLALGGDFRAHETVEYEHDVRPILDRSCGGGACHIGQVTSGVDLSSYEAILASVGSQYGGPIVVSGEPDESPLFDKIANETPAHGARMPFGLDPLSEGDIHTIEEWIEGGLILRNLPLRGDVNEDGNRTITDPIFVLNFLFSADGVEPECLPLADVNASGRVDIVDPIRLLNFLFGDAPPPPAMTEDEYAPCRAEGELSFDSIYEKVFARTCAFSSCHSAETERAGLSLATADDAYEDLVGVAVFNVAAQEQGLVRVAPGDPDRSFLLKKLIAPGPGEGNRMPANSPDPLSGATIDAIREWIRAGAPREGTIAGVPDISEEPPPEIERMPQPPVPEFGLQIHLEPFSIAPGSEREIFSFVDEPFQDLEAEEIYIKRVDIHMMEQSHHFIIYEWIGDSKPSAGLRPIGSTVDIVTNRRFQIGSQQSFFSLAFPPGVGIKFSRDTSFDFNSHYLNLNGEEVLRGEVYVNFFFAEPGEITTEVQPLFEIDPSINVPPNTTRTTEWTFPNLTTAAITPGIGLAGRVVRETHVYALSSHMHRHGDRFSAFLIDGGGDVDPPRMVYDSHDWDDPVYKVFDPPLVLVPGQGLRFETTHTYHDPPSPNSPPLTFGLTSEDEMAILLGYFAVP